MARDATKSKNTEKIQWKREMREPAGAPLSTFSLLIKSTNILLGFLCFLDQTRRRGSIYGRDLLGVFLRLWTCLALSELYDCLYDAFTLQWKTIILCVTGCWWSIAVGGSCTFPKCPLLHYTVHIAFSHNHWHWGKISSRKKLDRCFPNEGGVIHAQCIWVDGP